VGAVTEGRVLLAVDGNSLVHRSFHAQAATGSRSSDGRGIWAVRGLVAQLTAAVERIGPDAIVIGFDDPSFSQRKQQWPFYKATRTEKLESLVEQLELAIEILQGMGIAVVVPPGLEADDVLASAAHYAPTVGATTVIMTSDRDAFSLIDQHTRVLRIINGGVDASPMLTDERLMMMIGVRAEQYRDYAAMRGDASDNLPGVHGIGPKTAAKLLATLGSARAAFDDIAAGGSRVSDAIGAGATRKLAHPDARTAWELNCQVMTMHTDVELGLDLSPAPARLGDHRCAAGARRCDARRIERDQLRLDRVPNREELDCGSVADGSRPVAGGGECTEAVPAAARTGRRQVRSALPVRLTCGGCGWVCGRTVDDRWITPLFCVHPVDDENLLENLEDCSCAPRINPVELCMSPAHEGPGRGKLQPMARPLRGGVGSGPSQQQWHVARGCVSRAIDGPVQRD
jgi:5'-3' exonuclease